MILSVAIRDEEDLPGVAADGSGGADVFQSKIGKRLRLIIAGAHNRDLCRDVIRRREMPLLRALVRDAGGRGDAVEFAGGQT